MHWIRVALVLGMVPLTGCITMAGGQLADVSPAASTLIPSIEQTVGDFSFHLDGGKMVTSNKMGRLLNDELLARWRKSGFITDHKYVKAGEFSDSSEFRLTLSGHQEGESSVLLQIISGLTLTVIPYSVYSQMDVHYSLENPESGCVFEANATDSYRTVVGLLLLPVSPFGQSGADRTLERIANSLYAQLASQGAFEDRGSCREAEALGSSTESESDQPRAGGLISESE